MNRTLRAIIASIFIGIITFCAINLLQNVGKNLRVDITDQKLYTLSDGTKAILGRLNQQIKIKLYYAKTAALKGPDQIRFFNNYYDFVKSLLQEYAAAAGGMVDLQIIDPRPFSDDETEAIRQGLKRFPITEEENFFFGLVVQTQFGVEKNIPFFSPDRQNFIEYDISYLIDTAIRRQKKKIGILSSLEVMGQDASGYMAQMMRMQGQQPQPAWAIVNQLKQKYEVQKIETQVQTIDDVDILMVIHPKDLPETTLFAIDQYVLKGGRTIVCVDPHCFSDKPQNPQMQRFDPNHKASSNLKTLMQNWGLEMSENIFAGDRALAISASMSQQQRPQPIIGFLQLTKAANCFNTDNVISADLNQVRVLFAGALKETQLSEDDQAKIKRLPLVSTTSRGNTWGVDSPFELMMPNPESWMRKFYDGSQPVHTAYRVTGRFKSAFPDGIEVAAADSDEDNEEKKEPEKITGLTEAQADCAVAVFSDVDFITDALAYQQAFFGMMAVAGDNSAMLLNTIDDLTGSSDLISIRSRGNFKRPFILVDEIEVKAQEKTAEEEARINAEIQSFQAQLNQIVSSAKEGQEELLGSSILQKKKEIELNIHQAQRRLRDVKMTKRKDIEKLGARIRNFNTLPGPALILLIAVIIGIRRNIRKRHYISHSSDS